MPLLLPWLRDRDAKLARRRRKIVLRAVLLAAASLLLIKHYQGTDKPKAAIAPAGPFYVRPYLQAGDLGALPKHGEAERLSLLWQTADLGEAEAKRWGLEVQVENDWKPAPSPTSKRLAVDGLLPFRLYRGRLEGLKPGAPFAYRLTREGKVEFEAAGSARKPAGTPQRFVVFGDSGAGTAVQMPIAYQVFLEKPDYAMITGDIVYARGRISEYLANHFPVYNHDTPSATTGAPLLRSTLFLGAPGNHDLVNRSLDDFADGLGYFYYWDLPKNGPIKTHGQPQSAIVHGAQSRTSAFLDVNSQTYPVTTNYAYDYADAHWTVIDSNPYVDWTDPKSPLNAWLEADLAAAQDTLWRFVAFHHPGFHSSKAHFEDQRMRILAPLFEKYHVDIVFNGHVHNYQRSYPLKFTPRPVADSEMVDGEFTLDKTFDGQKQTRPQGIIYIVTGAGGAGLYDPGQTNDPKTWQGFTTKFVADVHSFTVADLDHDRLTVRQIDENAKEIDRFVLTHPSSKRIVPQK